MSLYPVGVEEGGTKNFPFQSSALYVRNGKSLVPPSSTLEVDKDMSLLTF